MRLRIGTITAVLALAVGAGAIGTAHAATTSSSAPKPALKLTSPAAAGAAVSGLATFTATLTNVPAGQRWNVVFRVWNGGMSVSTPATRDDAASLDGSGTWHATWDSTRPGTPAIPKVDAIAGPAADGGWAPAAVIPGTPRTTRVSNGEFPLRPPHYATAGKPIIVTVKSLPKPARTSTGIATVRVVECAGKPTLADMSTCDNGTLRAAAWRATRDMKPIRYVPVQVLRNKVNCLDPATDCHLAVLVTFTADIGFGPVLLTDYIRVSPAPPANTR